MYKFTPVIYTLKPGTPAQYTNGVMNNGKEEFRAAEKLLSTCGHSRFSVVAFGNQLHSAHTTEEEKDKVFLGFLYYVNALSGEDTNRGRMAALIMNTMRYHGYVV